VKQKKPSSYDDLSPVGWHPSEKLIKEVIDWSADVRGDTGYTRDQAIEALHNVVHFFRVLAKMDREQKARASEATEAQPSVSEAPQERDRGRLEDPGSYVLIVQVANPITVKIGRMGNVKFGGGFYAYCGSAKKGIWARVQRHLRGHQEKKLHWHIDYLLDSLPAGSVVQVWAFPNPGPSEHDLINALLNLPGCNPVANGFGSSDCRQGCNTHLVRCSRQPKIEDTDFPNRILLDFEA